MADVPELPNEMWSMIYYRVRRTAASIVQAAARGLGPRRALRYYRRQQADRARLRDRFRRRDAIGVIRRILSYDVGYAPGVPFGSPYTRRIGYQQQQVDFATLRDRITARLTSLGYMPAAAA